MADLTNAFRELARLSKNAALRSEVPTMWWGAVVNVGTDTVSVVLEQDDSVVVREVTVNAAGPCLVGDEVLLMKQGADLTIVANQTSLTRNSRALSVAADQVGPDGDTEVSYRLVRDRPWGQAWASMYLAANSSTAEWAVALRDGGVGAGTLRLRKTDGLSWTAAGGSARPFAFADQLPAVAMATGTVSITPSAANTPTYVDVSFPSGRFSSAPTVQVTAATSVPGSTVTGVGVTNTTATGCRIYVTRVNTVSTPVNWLAVQV